MLNGGGRGGEGAVSQPQQGAVKIALPRTPQAVSRLFEVQGLPIAKSLGHGAIAGQAVHCDSLRTKQAIVHFWAMLWLCPDTCHVTGCACPG